MILTVSFLTEKNGYNSKKDFQSTKKTLKKKNQNLLHAGILDFVLLKISKKGKIKTKKVK